MLACILEAATFLMHENPESRRQSQHIPPTGLAHIFAAQLAKLVMAALSDFTWLPHP